MTNYALSCSLYKCNFVSQNYGTSGTLKSMQKMSSEKKSAVCCLLTVVALQVSAVLYALVRIQLEGLRGFNASAPQALLVFLFGIGLEVVGVLYIVVLSIQAEGPKLANIDVTSIANG